MEARGRKLLIEWAAGRVPISYDVGGKALDLNRCIEAPNRSYCKVDEGPSA